MAIGLGTAVFALVGSRRRIAINAIAIGLYDGKIYDNNFRAKRIGMTTTNIQKNICREMGHSESQFAAQKNLDGVALFGNLDGRDWKDSDTQHWPAGPGERQTDGLKSPFYGKPETAAPNKRIVKNNPRDKKYDGRLSAAERKVLIATGQDPEDFISIRDRGKTIGVDGLEHSMLPRRVA
jgi:hypothetical protein